MPLVILLYALFASVFTIAKWGLLYSDPLFLVGIRMVGAGLILLGFLSLFRKRALAVKTEYWPKMIGLALFNIYLTNCLEFWGLRHLSSFKTCFIYSLSPFLSALFSYFLLSEVLTRKKWLGLLIGVFGMAPILLTETKEEAAMQHLLWFSWPEMAVIGAAVATVYGWILMRQIVHEGGHSPIAANGYSMLLGGLFSLVHSFFIESWDPLPIRSFLPFLIATLALLLISNLICYNLYGYLLKKFTAPFLSLAGYMTPFFAALFGWSLLGETIPLPFFISGGLIFVGLVFFYQEELRIGYRMQPIPVQPEEETGFHNV